MDSFKLEKLITDNMKAIFGFALTRLGDVTEAEYLASDILYELVRSAQNLRDEERFYGFMWKIAENTYVEYLRRKSRNAKRNARLDEQMADKSDCALEEIIRNEDLNLLRRELSLLSKQYRDATVLYYIEGLSCSETAAKVNVSTEMVKYYLFRARKIIREGMSMERLFGEKSYRPTFLGIDFWGTKGGEDSEYNEFQRRKIKGNILLAAYYSPVTLQEISIELGVALPYLEDEIRLLTDRQYLVYKNGKYLTNIPIFTLECQQEIEGKLKGITEAAAGRFASVTDRFSECFGERFGNVNLMRWQILLLCLHFSMLSAEKHIEKKFGELPADGPYSVVNGGGGRGIVWGKCSENEQLYGHSGDIRGIYDDCPSTDGRGSVIAMNFRQTLNAQFFRFELTDPVVCTAVGCFEYLPEQWQERLESLGYSSDGRPNFAVYSRDEYDALTGILKERTDIVSELNFKALEIAESVTADLAPAHVRKTAGYVGAIMCRTKACSSLVNALYDMNWVKDVEERDKPSICVVKS